MSRRSRPVLAAGVLVGGGALVLSAAFAAVAVAMLPLGVTGGDSTFPSNVPRTAGAVAGIPQRYLAAFDAAAARFAVPWSVLAGIYRVECDFGASRLPGCPPGTSNSVGAQGPGQFLPGTWRHSLGPRAVIVPGPPAPDGAGYATDGDGDGVADAWNPFDAAASTARLLAADGAARDLGSAIFGYNHDQSYVAQVLALATTYERARSDSQVLSSADPGAGGSGAGGSGAGGSGAGGPVAGSPAPGGRPPGAGAVTTVIGFARAQLGLPYRWGGSGPGSWDCSGLVQAAMAGVGIRLAHDAAAQYSATASSPAPLGALMPGDLVFYGSSAATIHHVGIAVDGGHMIDAPFTGASVRVDPVAAGDLLYATRPL